LSGSTSTILGATMAIKRLPKLISNCLRYRKILALFSIGEHPLNVLSCEVENPGAWTIGNRDDVLDAVPNLIGHREHTLAFSGIDAPS
jgi:hypothetical protein